MAEPKRKICKVKNINSIRKYLLLFSGVFQLTDAEINVLAEMIRYHLRGLYYESDPDATSMAAKKIIAERLELGNPYSINTYLQRLREKGAILPGNKFHPWLLPKGEKIVEIHIDWNLNILE